MTQTFLVVEMNHRCGSVTERIQSFVSIVYLSQILDKTLLIDWSYPKLSPKNPEFSFPNHNLLQFPQLNKKDCIRIDLHRDTVFHSLNTFLRNGTDYFKDKSIVVECNRDLSNIIGASEEDLSIIYKTLFTVYWVPRSDLVQSFPAVQVTSKNVATAVEHVKKAKSSSVYISTSSHDAFDRIKKQLNQLSVQPVYQKCGFGNSKKSNLLPRKYLSQIIDIYHLSTSPSLLVDENSYGQMVKKLAIASDQVLSITSVQKQSINHQSNKKIK